MFFHNNFSSVWVGDWPPFEKELLTRLSLCSLCILIFVILVISHFGFEGGIWVLIAPVPGHCILVTFILFSLFETHPEVHDAFMPFRKLHTSELEYSTILRSHAMRVMSTVDKCIARLDNRPKLRELMTDMGIRHQNYTVKMEYIDVSKNMFYYLSCVRTKTYLGGFRPGPTVHKKKQP